jgi:hypothetical protein
MMQALILLIVEFRVGLLNHVSKITSRSAVLFCVSCVVPHFCVCVSTLVSPE